MCRCRRNHRGDGCVESPMTIDEPTATPELVFRRDALSEPGMSPERFAAEFRLLRGEVHIGRGEMLTARQRVIAIASAAQGDPVVGGQAAMVMHGSRWFDSDFPILLIRGASASGRAARGSVPRRDCRPNTSRSSMASRSPRRSGPPSTSGGFSRECARSAISTRSPRPPHTTSVNSPTTPRHRRASDTYAS